MGERKTYIIQNLEANRLETVAFFKTLTPENLAVRVYQEDTDWTVKLILAHFVTIERSMHSMFNNMLSGGPGSPRDFDINRFKEMSEEDLDREGWHVFHGQGTLERFIRWAYEHVQLHIADSRAALNHSNAIGKKMD